MRGDSEKGPGLSFGLCFVSCQKRASICRPGLWGLATRVAESGVRRVVQSEWGGRSLPQIDPRGPKLPGENNLNLFTFLSLSLNNITCVSHCTSATESLKKVKTASEAKQIFTLNKRAFLPNFILFG